MKVRLVGKNLDDIVPYLREYGLTVTEGELILRWAGSAIRMKAGETCLLAKNSPEMALEGIGAAALAMPG